MNLRAKQGALLAHFKSKHLNYFKFHKRLFDTLVLSCFTFAAQTWAWPICHSFEAIQNSFFRNLFNLPFKIPEYLLHIELDLSPLKFRLAKATFSYWIKLTETNTPVFASFWWRHWLNFPTFHKHKNPLSNFIQLLVIPPNLNLITLDRLNKTQIEEVQVLTLTTLKSNHLAEIQRRIEGSTFYSHYKFLSETLISENTLLTSSNPWLIKKLSVQLRLDKKIYSPKEVCFRYQREKDVHFVTLQPTRGSTY